MPREFHVVHPSQELTAANGAAILNVAAALVSAARMRGVEAYVLGGTNRRIEIPHALGVVADADARNSALDSVLKMSLGKQAKSSVRWALGNAQEADVFVLHSLPWLVEPVRRSRPRSRIFLYVHNEILRGASARIVDRILSKADGIVFVSSYLKHEFFSRFPGRLDSVRWLVVRNTVNAEAYGGAVRGIQMADICYVGRLVPEKGPHVLIDALNLVETSTSVSCRIVGGRGFLSGAELSDYEKALRASAAVIGPDCGLVDFTGPVPPGVVVDYMNQSKVLVVPSLWNEPCGLVVAEGLASRAAVVASRVGGIPEFDSSGGVILVAPGDPAALATEVSKLLNSEVVRRDVAERGRSASARWGWSDAYGALSSWIGEAA